MKKTCIFTIMAIVMAMLFTAVPTFAASKPGNTKITGATTTTHSITVCWTKAKGATSYIVYDTWDKVGTTKGTSYKLEKLSPGTTHFITVQPVKSYKVTKWYNKKTKKWQTTKPAKKYRGKSKKVTKTLKGNESTKYVAKTKGGTDSTTPTNPTDNPGGDNGKTDPSDSTEIPDFTAQTTDPTTTEPSKPSETNPTTQEPTKEENTTKYSYEIYKLKGVKMYDDDEFWFLIVTDNPWEDGTSFALYDADSGERIPSISQTAYNSVTNAVVRYAMPCSPSELNKMTGIADMATFSDTIGDDYVYCFKVKGFPKSGHRTFKIQERYTVDGKMQTVETDESFAADIASYDDAYNTWLNDMWNKYAKGNNVHEKMKSLTESVSALGTYDAITDSKRYSSATSLRLNSMAFFDSGYWDSSIVAPMCDWGNAHGYSVKNAWEMGYGDRYHANTFGTYNGKEYMYSICPNPYDEVLMNDSLQLSWSDFEKIGDVE